MKARTFLKNRKGFTLMETVIAIGIIGVLLVVFVSLFVPAKRIVRTALAQQSRERIINTLKTEMDIVRSHEQAPSDAKQSSEGKYTSAFDKAFYWIRKTKSPSTAIAIFSYRGDLSQPRRNDGSLRPVTGQKDIPGQNSMLVNTACLMDDTERISDMKYAVGPVFLVKLTQLIRSGNGTYETAKSPGSLGNPNTKGQGIQTPDRYVYDTTNPKETPWGGSIMCRAEFYLLTPPDPNRVKNKTWDDMGKPFIETNLPFRR